VTTVAPHGGTAPGIDAARLGEWLAQHVEGLRAPFTFELIAAGGSNLTYRVTGANGRAVALRRPPVTAVLATAHDMDREWRIIDALHRGSQVPVPTPLARCRDVEVTGAPFYVMEFVEGLILRTVADSAGFSARDYLAATESLVGVQVALHALDVDAVGLGDLARTRTGYVVRQLHRWKTQVDAARVRDLPVLDEVHEALAASVPPESGPPGLVHGDYRFDNTVLGADRRLAAVLDWELATIGDPVADFAWSLCYWVDPGDPVPFIETSPTLDPGFPRRAEVADRYARQSGRDLTPLPWLRAFSYWKMGCIVEGVYARRLRGARGGAGPGDPEAIARRAEGFLHHAAALLSGG
jgi:aminoglycoside phosphotransferase (APT) family kinase protein